MSRGGRSGRDGGRLRRALTSPLLLILLLAPYFGEGLSGSTSTLDLVLPWNLALFVALYGCGALLCREVAYRLDLGFVGLVILAAGYGIWEEALVDRFWFNPSFWHDSGVGDYSVVWHTNVLLAVHLTAFHTAVSICASVLVVEWLHPERRHVSWARRRGLVVASLALLSTPVLYGEFDKRPPMPVLLAAAGLLVAVLASAVAVGRRRRPHIEPDPPTRRPRGLGTVGFLTVLAHWVITYSVPSSGLFWPVGVVLSLVPLVVGAVWVRLRAGMSPYGPEGLRLVVGMLWFFCLLDAFVGLLGRYDVTVGAALLAWALVRLRRSAIRRGAPVVTAS